MTDTEGFPPQKLWLLPLFILVIYASMKVTSAGLASLPDGFDALVEVGLPVWTDVASIIDGVMNSIPFVASVLGFVGGIVGFIFKLMPSVSFDFWLVGELMGVIGIYSFVGTAFLLGLIAAVDPESYPN